MVISSLAACANINQYAGDNAALIPIQCGAEIRDPQGKQFKVYSSINEIDGSFTAAGGGCPNLAVYRIKPGLRHLKVIPNLDNDGNPALLFATVDVSAELKPSEKYELLTSFSGAKITIQVREITTGKIVGTGESSEIRQSSKANAALQAVPLLKR